VISWWQLLLIANSAVAYVAFGAAMKGQSAAAGKASTLLIACAAWLGCIGATIAMHGAGDTLLVAGVSLVFGLLVYAALRVLRPR
jgi:hypothetical protein